MLGPRIGGNVVTDPKRTPRSCVRCKTRRNEHTGFTRVHSVADIRSYRQRLSILRGKHC